MLEIHLPWFISLHAALLAILGFRSLFFEHTHEAFTGITLLGLSAGYVFCSYMPIEQNAFLYASVPVRVLLGLAAGSRIVVDYISGQFRAQHSKLFTTLIYDGLGGLVLGWYLGRFDGIAPAFAAQAR